MELCPSIRRTMNLSQSRSLLMYSEFYEGACGPMIIEKWDSDRNSCSHLLSLNANFTFYMWEPFAIVKVFDLQEDTCHDTRPHSGCNLYVLLCTFSLLWQLYFKFYKVNYTCVR